MRAKLFTDEELEKCYDKMSRDGKEYESISEEDARFNLYLSGKVLERFLEVLEALND